MHHVSLHIVAGSSTPQIALTSHGAQITSVPFLPLAVPATTPSDGAALWRALPPPIQRALSELAALNADDTLPLTVDVALPALAAWPWEQLGPDAPGAQPFSLSPHTPLVRFLAGRGVAPVRPGTLRALAITAAPRDYDALDTAAVVAALHALHDPARGAVTVQEHCDPVRLRARLAEVQPDLLLILAHGEPGALVLEDQDGASVPLPAGELATLLEGTPVRAVVLASCDGATPLAAADNTAETLLHAGVLGVVAMHGAISVRATAAFLAGLLGDIAAGQPLEVAVVAGRKAVIASQSMAGPWAVPLCWQRALHRPLVLAPAAAMQRGAASLISAAPHWGTQRAAGGALGLLAAFSLQSLVLPSSVAVPAVITLLEGLGLNVFAGYLGGTLQDIWRRAGKQPANTAEVSRDDVAKALVRIALTQDRAAQQIERLARESGALPQMLDAINRGVAGSNALLDGLKRDLDRHGAALDGLRADLRQGLAAVHQVTLGIQTVVHAINAKADNINETTQATRAGVERIDARLGAGERERREREQAQLDDYLQSVITDYQQVRLSRFVDERQGNEERKQELYLQDVYTALTTDGAPVAITPRRGDRRAAKVVARALRLFARATDDRVSSEQVRQFAYQEPARQRNPARRGAGAAPADTLLAALFAGEAARAWTNAELPDDIAGDTLLKVRLLRPELVVEACAPLRTAPERRLVLLGDPGSGKSTVLRYLAVLLAAARLRRQPAVIYIDYYTVVKVKCKRKTGQKHNI